MGRITPEARKLNADKQAEYKQVLTQLLAREKNLAEVLKHDESGAGYKRLALADETLNAFSYCVHMNSVSVAILGVKNEDMLTEARKVMFRAMKYMEDVVTPFIDVPFSDYEENLAQIEGFEPDKRYLLLRKFGFAIQQLQDAYGDNSKWKWAFAEIWAKYAAIAKNMLDLKKVAQLLDFDSPYRDVTHCHLELVKKLFREASDRYREKYELVSNKSEDFRVAITYISALRRLHLLFGDKDEAETLKKKIDIWKAKMEADAKKAEEKAKGR